MEVELPLRPQQHVKSYNQFGLPLAVIISNKNYHGWVLEKFIQIVSAPSVSGSGNHLQYVINKRDNVDLTRMEYGEVLEIVRVNSSTIENPLEFLISAITDGFYVHCELDEYYLSSKEAYKNTHLIHPSLIYGYNSNEASLKAFGFAKGGLFKKFCIDNDHFLSAIQSSGYASKKNHIDSHEKMNLFTLSLKNREHRYIFELEKFKEILKAYLDLSNLNGWLNGIAVYDVITSNLLNPEHGSNFIKYNTTHFMYEHKKMFKYAIKYFLANVNEKEKYMDLYRRYSTHVADAFEEIRLFHISSCMKSASWPYITSKTDARQIYDSMLPIKEYEIDIISDLYCLL